ncbi:MAG: TetR/AcrR family transcriptional regulator [Acidimicrobiales bacterium]|nr:TetR/AcrR family transcriptional regulator [Acidimicrobiales bacterium]
MLARRDGLAAFTLRDLAAQVGMKAPSLYGYVESKNALYDAMFLEGNEAFAAAIAGVAEEPGADEDDAAARARRTMRAFFTFCTQDPVRFQLLFQRTIPGFEPSPASYAVARRTLDTVREQLAEFGVRDDADVDLWTAVATGLVSQQLANDPGGDRWVRLIDRAVAMLLAGTVRPAT